MPSAMCMVAATSCISAHAIDSRGVIEILIKMQQDTPGQVICLRGNHEALILNAMGWQEDEGLLWVSQGGARTLLSYGVKQPAELPPEHLNWIASLPLRFDDGRRLFVHAGVNPSMPLDRQAETDLLWIREPFLSSDRDYGRLIVHGHTPLRSGGPELRPNRLNLDTGAVYGGPLTAAVFNDHSMPPIAVIDDVDGIWPIE
jgi:diadenosine tetraphosphatase ApaH/serine/threonine PP2A family protein phosphatase